MRSNNKGGSFGVGFESLSHYFVKFLGFLDLKHSFAVWRIADCNCVRLIHITSYICLLDFNTFLYSCFSAVFLCKSNSFRVNIIAICKEIGIVSDSIKSICTNIFPYLRVDNVPFFSCKMSFQTGRNVKSLVCSFDYKSSASAEWVAYNRITSDVRKVDYACCKCFLDRCRTS